MSGCIGRVRPALQDSVKWRDHAKLDSRPFYPMLKDRSTRTLSCRPQKKNTSAERDRAPLFDRASIGLDWLANLSKNGVGVGDDISVGAAPSRAFASLASPIRCCPTQKAPSSPSPVLHKAPRERARSAFELAANPPLFVLLSAGPVAHTRDAFDRDDGDGLQLGSGVISVVLASRPRSAALALPPCATRPLPFPTSCEFPFATLAGSTSRAAHAAASQTSGNWLRSATALSQFACTPAESLTSTNPSALDHPNPTTATPLLLALSRSAPAHVDIGDAIGTKEQRAAPADAMPS
ncbi:hypothetical protein PANT_7c00084 [Moesziomyces antarcticus T-34]|uniref:Uncharacterized protein n=1 Tax=Pseudozyma antarctica (strain T-34) TaxID=1151754 RepID=M9LYW3_PSEA3|nr:hypothetical protein PANT_7c00084 [Moesziomyces antarcticus T-34]